MIRNEKNTSHRGSGLYWFFGLQKLLDLGLEVYGLDNLNDYYDPRLKLARLDFLTKKNMPFSKIDLVDTNEIKTFSIHSNQIL